MTQDTTTLEQHSHMAVAAVKRLLHTPAGSNAEAAASVDAIGHAMGIINGVADRASGQSIGEVNRKIREGLLS